MKKTLSLALVVLMVVACFAVFTVNASAETTWELKDGVLTISGTGEMEDYRGKEAERPWAANSNDITKVVVTDGVTKVGSSSFTKLPNVTEITIGKDVTEIGMDAFSYGDSLTTLVFNGPIETIGQGICFSCAALASVTITGQTEEQFKEIAKQKNYNIDGVPEGWTDMPLSKATYTVNGTVEPEPPVDENKIEWTLKDGVLTISGKGEMQDYRDKEGERPWADKLEEITEVVVSDGITKIGSSSFTHCAAATKVTVGKDVKEIGMDAFSYCSALEEIVFNGKVETIGQGIVYSDGALAKVTVTGQTKAEFLEVAHVKNYNTAFDNCAFTENQGTPVTGEATIALVIIAVVALFGTAVVASKKVFSK